MRHGGNATRWPRATGPRAATLRGALALCAAAALAAGTAACRIEARAHKSVAERQHEQDRKLHALQQRSLARAENQSTGTGAHTVNGHFQWPDPSRERSIAVVRVKDFGTIRIALYPEIAPHAVARFVELARQGFYDGTTFHRVVPGFVIQGGDPLTRNADPRDDGRGGSGQRAPDELSDAPHLRGVVSLANQGRAGTADSQFFVVLQDERQLDHRYTVLGRVVAGMRVADAIATVPVDHYGRYGPPDRPLQNVVVESVRIERGVPAKLAAEDAAAEKAANAAGSRDRGGPASPAPPGS